VESLFASPYYARYILPGVAFTTLVVLLPLLAISPSTIASFGTAEILFLLVSVALVSGYSLDVAGTYKLLNPSYKRATTMYYARIVAAILDLSGDEKASEIKDLAKTILARLWARFPDDYERLVEEPRAKWVLSLQCAFLFRLSGLIWIAIASARLLLHWRGPAMQWGIPVVYALIALMSFIIGLRLSRRGLNLASMADEVAITLLLDRREPLRQVSHPKITQ